MTRSPTSPPLIGTAPRVLTQDVIQRLCVLNEDAYGTRTFADLKRVLAGTACDEPYKSDGRMVVGRDRVARALAYADPTSCFLLPSSREPSPDGSGRQGELPKRLPDPHPGPDLRK